MAITLQPQLLLNSQIASLTREITEKEVELLRAKNLLHSLKSHSRESQKCQFIAEGRVKHIRRGHVVIENSHPITTKPSSTKIVKYLENLTENERLNFFKTSGLL
jgi:ABC-type arginine transport system ATPase subunit